MSMSMPFEPLEVEDYHDQYYESAPHFLLDVRTEEEFDEVRIPGAVNIPLNELGERVAEVPQDAPIVLVCRSGVRSQYGAQVLRQAGFTDLQLYNLEGGTIAWARRGWPTETGA
jgi:rhodanese-related sulfurtransferase